MSYPYGWDQRGLAAVTKLADYFKASPRGLLAIFNSESGLQPHLAGPAGYYGLIMAKPAFIDSVIGDSWVDIVLHRDVVSQLAAIKTFWDQTAKHVLGGDSVQARAKKLGVRGDTVLYSLNFVPAYFAHVTRARDPMVISAAYAQKTGMHSPDGGQFYHDNSGFDVDGKGYISVLDVQKRIDHMAQLGAQNSATAQLFGAVKEPFPWKKAAIVTALLGGGIVLITRE